MLKQRIISGIIAAITFLFFLYLGSYAFLFLILLMSLIGFYEFIKLNQLKLTDSASIIGFIALIYFILSSQSWMGGMDEGGLLWILMFLLLMITVFSKNRLHIEKSAVVLLGLLYIGTGFYSMIQVRLEEGLAWALMIFACIWFTDIGAYLCGRWFGKHLLWPSISPKKTVEGAVGGTVFSILTAIVFMFSSSISITWIEALLLGFTIALLSQAGDFIQSAYKRHAGIKDSGKLIPGHGGILDRCDSWIIVFPFVFYFF